VECNADFSTLAEAAHQLTPYSIAFRYPGPALEPTADDAIEALALSCQVFETVTGAVRFADESEARPPP